MVVAAVLAVSGLAVVAPTAGAATAVETAAATPSYQVFTGSVADFYEVPDPLPAGNPGDLIRVQAVSSDAASTTVRIMYHSIDGAGRDRAVTGTLTYPNAAPPPGGWPVMSIANGTVGLGSQCAISRAGNPAPDFGIGGVAVDSDYIGEGPVGEVQAYLSRASEGHSVLDAVRAARNYAAAHAGSRFLVLGGSQGGHGALSASELAASYAPELDLLGTVSLAPAAMFGRTYGALDEVVTRVVTAMGVVGLATEHPDIDLADYASPAGLAALQQIRTECRADIITTVLGVQGPFFTHDPRTTEPAESIMMANDVGHVAAPSPVLLIQGTADTTVNPQRTADLYARMCSVGQVTDYVTVPGADHGNVTTMAMGTIQAWLQARLAGDPAPNSCLTNPPTTTTTSTTTTTVPATTRPTTSTSLPAGTTTSTTSRVEPVATNPSGHSSGNGSGGASKTGGPSSLPATGAAIGLLGGLALVCGLGGVVLVAATRRRTAGNS